MMLGNPAKVLWRSELKRKYSRSSGGLFYSVPASQSHIGKYLRQVLVAVVQVMVWKNQDRILVLQYVLGEPCVV